MRYLKLFESFENIDIICRKYNIIDYTINIDGSIDTDDNVDLDYLILTKLPLKFNKINGYFDCSRNKLTTLKGCPEKVNGDFYSDNNEKKFTPSYIRSICKVKGLIDSEIPRIRVRY